MKAIFALAAFMAVFVAPLCHAQISEAPALDATIEHCIRDNASKVERAVADLSSGVTFLVQDICAMQTATVQRRETQARVTALRAAVRQSCEASRASAPPAQQAQFQGGDLCDTMSSMYDNAGFAAGGAPLQADPEATALAAELLLDQRLTHTSH